MSQSMMSTLISPITTFLRSNNRSALAISGIVIYLSLVKLLRFRRRDQIKKIALKCNPSWELEEGMTDAITYEIFGPISMQEFPLIYRKSLEFALFKTYGIPTISRLLDTTKEFKQCAGKRYDDTDLLLTEIAGHPLSHDRSHRAQDRMNEIHGRYKISNDDYLYTLCLFVMEPINWINEYEWRKLEDWEVHSIFITWKRIGERMGITGIPDNIKELDAWYQKYEQEKMTYAITNRRVADTTTALFLSKTPKFLHPYLVYFIYALMKPHVLKAFGYPEPPQFLRSMMHTTLKLRGWFIRHFCLPRVFQVRRIPEFPNREGLYIPNFHSYERTYEHGYTIEGLGPKRH
ncbi:hypothetical protein HDU76_008155 [Blyttiomyces sp. JEL0837]|nr:hypothetical protein HDU76_008155 [Blyttiomyces sp. JEL0837]